MKSIKKSLVLFYSPLSLYFSLFCSSFVAKIQILQKINQLNSHRPHPPQLPHYCPNPPLPFKHRSRQAPCITETTTPFPRNHLHSPPARPLYLQPPRTVDLSSTERLLLHRSSSSVQTTLTSHHEIVPAMALPSACLSASNLEAPLLHPERVP
jgi:hypothetical protein